MRRTVIASVPGGIAVIRTTVIDDSSAVPVTVPTAIAPTIPAAHHGAHGDADSKRKNRSGCNSRGAVARSYIGSTVNDCRVICRDIHDLRIRWLNHDRLWRLLYDRDLRP